MKKTKRFLGLLLAVIMVFTTLPVGAAFSDVPETLPQLEAVEVLSGLGLIAGYTEGDKTLFKPEGQITRAEFTAMLTRALKLAEIGAIASTPFEDVAADHWASANIRIAFDMGIIRGYDAKTFGPEDNVTYEQAIKMMVCALGFENQATLRGGYPGGYVNVALDKKLLGKVSGTGNKPATRADIAQMIYNSFGVDIALENGVNADGTPNYVITPGKTLLTEKLELDYIEGQVTAIDMTALDSGVGVTRKNAIEVEDVLISVPEDTDQSALLGRKVTVYYETNDSGAKTAKYIHQSAGDNVTVTVSYDAILDVTDNELVYETADDEISLEYDDLSIIYNKKQVEGDPSDLLDIRTGEVTLLDMDDDEVFDVAFVSEYEVVHVNKVDTVNHIVTDYNNTGSSIVLTPTTETKGDQLKIYKDGKEVPFSTIRNRSTLSVYKSKNTSGDKLTEVHIAQKSVRGKIEKIRGDIYVISGKEYKVSYYCNEEFELGQESTFYLDLKGDIVDTAAVALAGTKLYGYLTDVRYDENTEKVTLKLLPAGEDNLKSFSCTDAVVLDGVQVKNHETIRDQLALSALETNKDVGNSNTEYSQLIMYGVSGDKINAINTLLEGGSETSTTNLTPFSSLGEYTGEYKSSNKKFNFNSGITVGSATKIFVVPSDRKKTASYTTSLNLKDGKEYTVEAFEKSTVGVAGAVVIYGGVEIDEIAVDAPIYVVSDALESMLDENDESIVRIPVVDVQTGAAKTFDAQASAPIAAGLKKGDLIRFATNSDGTVRAGLLELLFDPTGDRPEAEDRETNDTSAFKTRYGTFYSVDTSGKQMLFTDIFPDEGSSEGERDLYSYSSAKIYVYDTTVKEGEEPIIQHSTSSSNIAYAQTINLIPSGATPSTVFMHFSENKVKFIYIVR